VVVGGYLQCGGALHLHGIECASRDSHLLGADGLELRRNCSVRSALRLLCESVPPRSMLYGHFMPD